MSSALAAREVATTAYPERPDRRPGALDRFGARLAGPIQRSARLAGIHPDRLVRLAAEHERAAADLSERELRAAADGLRAPLRAEGFRDELVARSFALLREAARRTLGERHYDVQLVGGRVLLAGLVAEMETGEGKTLTATLAAGTAALAGVPVHVVTVNDYLASRDAGWMAPVYGALGLRVGAIVHGMDPDARREAYAADVTYCTNKELAFDYLRDRLVLGRRTSRVDLQLERLYGESGRARRLTLRGLHYAIVDEADSVLVDEARTPLIISGSRDARDLREVYTTALELAADLDPARDYRVEGRAHQLELTEEGCARLAELAAPRGGVFTGRLRREDLVRQALVALRLFQRDRHYLVAGGKVQIIDEYTGRTMADRSWEQGLHQLIEVKEGCEVTGQTETLARISYQRFFRRYLRLAGMTGTAREVAGELWMVYRLGMYRVPTNRPLARRAGPDVVYPTAAARWASVVRRVRTVHGTGRPVLIGTRSVAAADAVSAALTEAGLAHRVLNARQDQEEADIVAEAGQAGRITVATNMAGRGTDIRLGPGVRELGGLHVIATERHEAGRIDRQLFGRCGRQGDPGSHQAVLSLEDELIARYAGIWRWLAVLAVRGPDPLRGSLCRWAVRRGQRAAERAHARARRDLLKVDEQLDRALAFSGRSE